MCLTYFPPTQLLSPIRQSHLKLFSKISPSADKGESLPYCMVQPPAPKWTMSTMATYFREHLIVDHKRKTVRVFITYHVLISLRRIRLHANVMKSCIYCWHAVTYMLLHLSLWLSVNQLPYERILSSDWQSFLSCLTAHLNDVGVCNFSSRLRWILIFTSVFSAASLKSLHQNLRSEMWTWKLTESLLKDLIDSELKAAGDEMMEGDDPEPVSVCVCTIFTSTAQYPLRNIWNMYRKNSELLNYIAEI